MPLQQKLERGTVAVPRKSDEIEVARTHVSGSFDVRQWQKLGEFAENILRGLALSSQIC
jgi:hypothetical protein